VQQNGRRDAPGQSGLFVQERLATIRAHALQLQDRLSIERGRDDGQSEEGTSVENESCKAQKEAGRTEQNARRRDSG